MKYLTIIIVLISFTNIKGQSLLEKIDGITNFQEIQKIGNEHYQELRRTGNPRDAMDPKEKHWRRWEWLASSRVDKYGNIINHSLQNYKASEKVKRIEEETNRSTASYWYFTGPDQNQSPSSSTAYIGLGRVDRIAFHPTQPYTIFVGSPAGGLWKTTNDGTTWTPIDDFLPSLGISGITISPTSPNTMYVLTGCGDGFGLYNSAGVFKSTDGGATWKSTASLTSTIYSGLMLTMDPNNDQVLFAATTEGLYKTTNGGDSWTLVKSGYFFDVKFKPGSSSVVYAVTNSAVYYSISGGNLGSWWFSSLSPLPSGNGRKAIAVTPANPDYVYVLTGPHTGAGIFSGIYKSTNSGASFTREANTPNILGGEGGNDNNSQSWYDFCLTASPTNPDLIIAGGLINWKSTNGGTTWSNVTTFGAGSNLPGYVHPDIHAVEYNPLNGFLYTATDGGFYRSIDNGGLWVNLSEGLNTATFYHMAGVANNDLYILGGLQDNGVKMRKTNTTTMDHIAGADGYSPAYNPIDPSISYCSINSGLAKFTSYGASSTSIMPRPHWFMEVATHQTNGNIIFAGTNDLGGRLYKSSNQGASWDTLSFPAGQSIATCPSNSNRIYIAGGNRVLHRTDNLGSSFDRIDDNPGFPTTAVQISDFAVRPTDSRIGYVSFSGYDENVKVYKTGNAGASWEDYTGSLPNVPAICLAVAPSGDVYVGTEIGVFFRKNGGNDWIPYRNWLPKTRVVDLIIYPASNIIRAATYGRGIWTSTLSDGVCNPTATWSFTTTMEGYLYYEASQYISNKSIIQGGASTEVIFKAGNYIELKDGFHAKDDGSIFKAYTGPCSEGVPDIDN